MAGYGEQNGGTFSTSYWNTKQGPSSSSYAVKSGAITAASGAAAGAAAGSVVGPIGTAVGAVIGAVAGAVVGAFGGSAKAKAKRYQRLAAQVQQQREANKDYNTFLQLIRQQRLARAATLAQSVASGTEMSSKTAGSVSGQQAQTAYSTQYLAEDRRLQTIYESYMRMSGKAASIANDLFAGFDTGASLAMTAASVYNASQSGTKPSTETPGGFTEQQLQQMDKAAMRSKPIPEQYQPYGGAWTV